MLMTSCVPTEYVTRYRYDENTTRYITPTTQPTFISPTIADLDISSTKVVESETYDNTLSYYDVDNLNKGNGSATLDYLKNLTISKVVKKHNADVIVAPIFDVKTSDDAKKIIITVTGYPATYKNFRMVTPADAEALRVYGIDIAAPLVKVK